MQAVAGAAQSILLGESAVALAGGVESMSRMPDAAILKAVQEHQVTSDVGGSLGTREAGDVIATFARV